MRGKKLVLVSRQGVRNFPSKRATGCLWVLLGPRQGSVQAGTSFTCYHNTRTPVLALEMHPRKSSMHCADFSKERSKHKPRQTISPAVLREIQTGVREANVIRKHMRRFKKVQKNMRNEMYKK